MYRSNRVPNLIGLLIFAILTLSLSAQQAAKAVNWESWKFLLGEWIGEGGGNAPGQASGGSKFYPDLQDRILVRTNYSQFPATKNRPAISHNDLMIIYQESGSTYAMYFDNEGHVIHYTAELSAAGNTLTFTSDIKPSEQRFRLIYSKEPGDKLKLKFEIAQPENPEAFFTYIESILKKKE